MADNEQIDDGAVEGDAAPVARKKGRRKLIIVMAAVALLLGGAVAGGWFWLHRPHSTEVHAEAGPSKPPVFVEVPDITVNMAGLPGQRIQYLKVRVVLEVKDKPLVEKIKPAMPRLVDIFQTYLRELRPVDLNGSAGLFRLKEELTRRVNAVIAPAQVNAVLFKEVMVQ